MKQLFSLAAILFILASCSKNVEDIKLPKETGLAKTSGLTQGTINVSNAGTCIDPNGKPAGSNYGIAIDPDGKPYPVNNSGTSLDPSGKPVTQNNYGIAIDPDGKPSPINNSGTSLDPSGKPIQNNAGIQIDGNGKH